MKCRSRSTLGIIIGALNVIVNFGLFILMIILLVEINQNKTNKQNDANMGLANTGVIVVLILCLILTILSALFIMGIVKRRYQLMTPWLVLAAIGFGLSCVGSVFGTLREIFSGQNIGFAFLSFTSLKARYFVIAIHGYILYKIYTLYNDIRAENVERPGQILTGGQTGFSNANSAQPNNYTPVPTKA